MSVLYTDDLTPRKALGDASVTNGPIPTVVSLRGATQFLYYALIVENSISTVSEAAELVDLDDTTNFPHSNTDSVWVRRVTIDAIVTSGSVLAYLGVVTENDDTDGSVKWLGKKKIDSNGQYVFDFYTGDPRGLCLSLSSGVLDYIASSHGDTDDAAWANTVNLISPVGTSNPEAGDLVMKFSPDASCDITVSIATLYSAE